MKSVYYRACLIVLLFELRSCDLHFYPAPVGSCFSKCAECMLYGAFARSALKEPSTDITRQLHAPSVEQSRAVCLYMLLDSHRTYAKRRARPLTTLGRDEVCRTTTKKGMRQ